ncbi:XRE family transcriptional regulator [Streptococcus suis]|uniref:XRE family transcriptional regulator n=1 Tax=Streptococcus suis TaxID=1307 RepID=UPI000D0B00F8|nr:XRE family transcriptional regulator [Streptococcus suis]MBS7854667.1 helix-turn-helix transcriptional regulator [Streptococcus suis]MBS7977726.1 helix-turn-helix transcriptional regulator [Streptococcus suis]MDG3109189.1 XRE family transcriptional regulator [Streptococcus suis]MDG3148014.1 XRE family transcriptional regulator [Streptococcus suis]MDG3170334.1 XRE family transcriptional regulator [Streptococcus suis]
MDEKKRMQIIAENITYYRKQRGITQKELAKEVGITPSTMTDYMKLRSAPSFGVIQKLADFFGIKKSDIDTTFKEEKSTITSSIPFQNFDPRQAILLSNYSKLNDTRKNKLLATSETLLAEEQGKIIDISEKRAEYDARKRISLSVPGKVSAGTGYWQEDDYDTMVDFYADEIPDEKDYDTVAVVVGHSMEPKIKNGDFLFIKLKDQVDLNKIGIFQVDGENYVKKLKSDHLESLNKDYDNIRITEGMRTIGEVVDVYREK